MKHLLAGLAAFGLLSGAAMAQTYPPAPPPQPLAPPPVVAPGPVPVPVPEGSTTTTTTHGVDMYGNPVTQKDTYRNGAYGSSHTQTTKTKSPWDGTTTQSTTTHE